MEQATVEPMAEERFWTLIATTTRFARNPERQLSALRARLEELPLEDLEAYEAAFAVMMGRAYSWDLWGAAYLINGGCSDDGFEYFRRWLVSAGREVFEQALSDPDSLAAVCRRLFPDWEFEEFGSVGKDIWVQRTGRPWDQMAVDWTHPEEPSGTEFPEEDLAYFARRYPKLWRRFGYQGIGGWLRKTMRLVFELWGGGDD